MTTRSTPLGAAARGLVAGAIGTAFMTIAQELTAKLQGSGDDGEQQGPEQSQPEDPWQQASAPAKVAKRISEGVFQHEVSPDRISLLTHGMHWSYGTGWGAVYGLAQATIHAPTLRHGLLFGTGVWAMSYVELVPMGLYEPPWKYSPSAIATEVGYHLVYGTATAAAYSLLDRR